MATEWKRVRVLAINMPEGKAYTKTYRNEPDAWTDFRGSQRPDMLFATIGRVEKFDNGDEIFTPWETWHNAHRRQLLKNLS